MKVVAVLGSPRGRSNTAIVAQKVLDAASAAGADVEVFKLNKLSYRGCQACMGCKKKKDHCILDDDLTPVLAAIREADAAVFASPVYFGDVTGQFKSFFDRTYSFFEEGFVTRLAPGKKAVLITAQGNESEKAFADVIPKNDMFLKMYGYNTTSLRAVGAHDAGDVEQQAELLQKAEEVGKDLVG